ncbi:MAG: YgiQ family radical SAM protein [Pseudomonadota bacterium]|nr:YgiQ family radical SAM protein [Pseudomonadota bacterium]
MFLPVTPEEVRARGWTALDVILVTGDSYLDSPYVGVAVIGKVLLAAGWRVGVIPQPDLAGGEDIGRLGAPRLFWGVTGGCIDSLVANRTASGRRRRTDDFTAGGINNRRPDRAVIAYANLIRRHFPKTCPIVLGGLEASLRRIAHYDFWSDRVRRSILFDAKADYLVYGMGENTVRELAALLQAGRRPTDLRGLCYAAGEKKDGFLEIPSWEEATANPEAFTRMFLAFYRNQDALTARGLTQRHGDRWLIHNPPAAPLTQREMDEVHDLDFARDAHPCHRRAGVVRALETIRFSIPTHRGCYGECNFCAIAVHEGRTVSSRSEASIIREGARIASRPDFKGYLHDVGGPTANMYGFECERKLVRGACPDRRCLYPEICPRLRPDHGPQRALLQKLAALPGVKQAVVASGIRCDLLLADGKQGLPYLRDVVHRHVSGRLKVAPEHAAAPILRLMGKPDIESLLSFRDHFRRFTAQTGKRQFLSCYFIAAHPGCSQDDIEGLRLFLRQELPATAWQVQIFTPAPATISTLMYYTERNPFSGRRLFVEKTVSGRERQKQILVEKNIPFRYAGENNRTAATEGKPWARTKGPRRKPRRNPPRR